jgi:hypothetical protein
VPIEKQYGVESKIAWVDFCAQIPRIITGGSAEAEAFYAGMKNNQV